MSTPRSSQLGFSNASPQRRRAAQIAALIGISLLTLAISLGTSRTAQAKLALMSLEEFRSIAPCAVIGRTVSQSLIGLGTQTKAETKDAGTLSLGINHAGHRAEIQWSGTFGDCPGLPQPLIMEFPLEDHASFPQLGGWAIFFPNPEDGYRTEAVYGRSIWRMRMLDFEVDRPRDTALVTMGPGITDLPPRLNRTEVAVGEVRKYWAAR